MERRSRNGVPWAWAKLAGLLVIATVAAVASAHPAGSQDPAGVPQRLVFGSVAMTGPGQPRPPMNLEFADPASGATQLFATAPSKQEFTQATWSNDSETIAFVHFASSSLGDVPGRGINTKPTAGGTEVTVLPASAPGVEHWISPFQPSWSPTKSEIAYWEQAPSSDPPYYADTLKVATFPGPTTRTLTVPYNPTGPLIGVGMDQPAWSADGKTIAFTRGRTGIVSLPATGGPLLQLVNGGPGYFVESPSYSPSGRDLAYVKYFEDQNGHTLWQLVVRDLRSGQERVIASGQQSFIFHGPQSWSPDSTQIAFTECCQTTTLNVVRRDGTGRRTLLQRAAIDAPAWGGSALPNYYIKDVEVAQAIAPELEPRTDVDPLADKPYELTWKLGSKNGHTMPLVAGKPTLVRIYVGDSSLRPGETARRKLSYRVEASTASGEEREDLTVVTADDVEPLQTAENGALNVVLSAAAAHAGAAVKIEVEINLNQDEKECEDCYPNGNKANLNDVRFSAGGKLVIVPVPIEIVDQFTTPATRYRPSPAYPDLLVPGLKPLIPAPDSGIARSFELAPIELGLWSGATTAVGQLLGCALMLESVREISLLDAVSPTVQGVPPSFAIALTKWVGYAGPPDARYCRGLSWPLGGCCAVLTTPQPRYAIHELGHSLGLIHRWGLTSRPFGSLPLPYAGIGGVGYSYVRTNEGGRIDRIFIPAETADLMSYDDKAWTSPLTWERMLETIRDESSLTLRRQSMSSQAPRTTAREEDHPAAATFRLVRGAITDSTAVIFDSTVAKAVHPESAGPLAGRIVALDSDGRTVATTPVRGKPYVFKGGATLLPFVIALPSAASIASLVLKGPAGKLLAERHRSATPPTGHFVGLPTQTAANRPLRVSWVATDADANKLSVTVFARRGERPWRPVAIGLANSSAVVRPRSLGSTGPLQLRLLINDRFRTVLVDSAPIPVN